MKWAKTANQNGAINILLIPVILLSLFFLGALGFGYWAFNQRQTYKDHADELVNSAVDDAVKTEDTKKDAQFAQDEKNPLKSYEGPEAYGDVKLSYPKTWSAYVDDNSNGSTDVTGYFNPAVVPSLTNDTSVYALRFQVINTSYSDIMRQFSSQVQAKQVTITPYSLPKVTSVIGSRVDGSITTTKKGSMVVLPLRDKTLEIWTESTAFTSDFNTIILPNVTFSP